MSSRITCPECGLVSEFEAVRRAADEFCGHCDYPLFWAPAAAAVMPSGEDATTTRRRLPGAAGRVSVGTRLCPECGELNPIAATHCVRCTADLDPPPPPEPEPVPEPEPEPVVEIVPEPEPQRNWWWLILVTILVAVAVAALILATR